MSVTSWSIRRLLDPLGGDRADEPDRKFRLNLRRVELASIAMIFNAAVEGTFSFFRDSPGLGLLAVVASIGAIGFIVASRRGQRETSHAVSHLPEIFVIYALVCSQGAGYFIAQSGRIPSGYAMVYLACAVFFLIPPRRFTVIGIATFALFVLWVSTLDVSLFEKVVAAFNTALAVVAGIFGRRGLDRMQEVDRQQRAQIAAQNEALVEANQRLATHNAELNSLMAIAAHDLRSPLFGLGNLLDLAAARPPSSLASLRDLLREASNSIAGMLGLIGRMLEAHEIESRSPRTLQCRDLEKMLETAARRARAAAERGRVTLIVEGQSPLVQTMVDPDALDQILDNLISNAIRFSPAGSTVRLRTGIADGAFIEIADEGIGVPLDERDQLFGKFRRGASRPLNGPRGSGLGLYIVRSLATAMGAESGYRPGKERGSVFRIDFG
ncbi:HAMP domain-containing sensor histidine kinase [Aquamicrobium sp. LC103]|uniref:sensor histidine kinase n=1 Tax=Aquamicrobium sp. LC103 TaxID=1120658 RepID=UPI00063E79CA|nr:HAMP domain-containing sensor histidine kinase [Aquamicrobium sp. LC103]TKT69887.1 HAMP domain-containing histidine kinase [Aquamicrobium sp. LC103]